MNTCDKCSRLAPKLYWNQWCMVCATNYAQVKYEDTRLNHLKTISDWLKIRHKINTKTMQKAHEYATEAEEKFTRCLDRIHNR